jgi:hypothetical protein
MKEGTLLHFVCKGPGRGPNVQQSPAYAVRPVANLSDGAGRSVCCSEIRDDQVMGQISPCNIWIILAAPRSTGWNIQARPYASPRPGACCGDVCGPSSKNQDNPRTSSRKRCKIPGSPPLPPRGSGGSPSCIQYAGSRQSTGESVHSVQIVECSPGSLSVNSTTETRPPAGQIRYGSRGTPGERPHGTVRRRAVFP